MLVELLINLIYLAVTALIGVVTVGIIYARWHYGTLERIKGLPVVIKPAFVGGSDVFVYKKIVHESDAENVKKYGKIFGSYEGRLPHIYISDPDMIRLILVKDFESFHNKRIMDFGHELINEMLDVLPYAKWKVVRSSMSPTLTTGKIRNMSLAMTEAIEDWVGAFKTKLEESNNEFLPRRIFMALTADVIARCGFGTRLNSLHDPQNKFVQELYKLVSDTEDMNFMLTVTQVFPVLMRMAPFFPKETLIFFNDFLKTVMAERRKNNVQVNDFVDILNEMYEKLNTDEYKKLGIRENTVMAQALIFFFADNFETIALTLTFLLYHLAKNPEVQDKLVAEVDAYLAKHNGKIEHETINELTYLAACVQETLRMHPPLIRLERVCNKEWFHEPTGLRVPENMVIQIPVHSIHYNPEYYPDPYTFNPERFTPENKDKVNPYTFLSFGGGNHNCIGMRFAKEELYLTMANVMRHFTFKPTPETKIKYRPGRTFILSCELFPLKAVRRSEE